MLLQLGLGSIASWDNRCTQHNPINDHHGFRTASPSPATNALIDSDSPLSRPLPRIGTVIAGLNPAIHAFQRSQDGRWLAVSSATMTILPAVVSSPRMRPRPAKDAQCPFYLPRPDSGMLAEGRLGSLLVIGTDPATEVAVTIVGLNCTTICSD